MTLVVVQHRRFPRSMLQRVKQGLANVGARIVGCVLNNTDIRHDEYYEYYTSYYQYYSPQHSTNRKQGENSGNELEKGQKHSKLVTSNDDEGEY